MLKFILLCETYKNDNIANLLRLPNYYFVFKNRKIKSKGGVSMYIRDNIQFNLREDLSIFIEGEFEYIFVESIINCHTTIVGVIYRCRHIITRGYLIYFDQDYSYLFNI